VASLGGAIRRAEEAKWRLCATAEALFLPPPQDIPIVDARGTSEAGVVDRYWASHTVRSDGFRCARESSKYLKWRFAEYPLFRELMQLWGDHAGQVVLDYGCGPGNDLTGFVLCSGAAAVIGADISATSLELARDRLMLHRADPSRASLLLIGDQRPQIPLADKSVDFINCGGVLHHTTYPAEILAEFRRVLKPGGRANVMVYMRESVYVHLFVAFVLRVVEGRFEGSTLEEAFEAFADGEGCPRARLYRPREFTEMCAAAGFDVEYCGGYLSQDELTWLRAYREMAMGSPLLGDQDREFLRCLTIGRGGIPLHEGMPAGLSGVFRLAVGRDSRDDCAN
jgi:SAM-dependent methyltransferase